MHFAIESRVSDLAGQIHQIMEPAPRDDPPVFVENYYRMRDLLAIDLAETRYIGAPAKDLPDLFQKAHRHIQSIWQREVRPFVDKLCMEWQQEIPDTQTDLKEILKDTATVDQMIHIHQIGALEPLRHIKPDAWYTLLLASSLAQRSSISAIRKMVDTFEAKDLHKIGLTHAELDAYLEIATTTGEAFDLLYLKQIILADNPDTYHLLAADDNDRAYEWKDTERKESHTLPFFEVFQQDFIDISHQLHRIGYDIAAGSVNTYVLDGDDRTIKTPAIFSFSKFNGLPPLLNQFAELLTSAQTDSEFVSNQWNMLMSLVKRMALVDHCPILLFPPLMASIDGEKTVDMGYRLGLRTKALEQQERIFDSYRNYAQEIISANIHALHDKTYEVPPIVASYQFFAFGPDLWWRTQGDSHEDLLMIHPDAIADAAREFYIPIARQMLESDGLTDKQIIEIITELNGIHEIAHTIMTTYDKDIATRIGAADNSCILEELKANSLTMKLLKKRMESEFGSLENTPDTVLRAYMNVYLSQLLYFQLYKSSEKASGGERYFYPSLLILNELLEVSETDPIMKLKDDGKLHMENPVGFINRLDEIADTVLVAYTDTQSPPEQIQADIRQFTQDVYAWKDGSKAETMRQMLGEEGIR